MGWKSVLGARARRRASWQGQEVCGRDGGVLCRGTDHEGWGGALVLCLVLLELLLAPEVHWDVILVDADPAGVQIGFVVRE